MAKSGDTFFLRTEITYPAGTTTPITSNIDISAYTMPASGKVLVVDRGFITFSGDSGPLIPADIIATGNSLTRGMKAQVCSEIQTALVSTANNSLFMEVDFYATAESVVELDPAGAPTGREDIISMINQENAMNPAEYTGGFIVPTDAISCIVDVGGAWAGGVDVGFVFEVHTERLSMSRLQELLVSLTAN
jgi:hypothetical protein